MEKISFRIPLSVETYEMVWVASWVSGLLLVMQHSLLQEAENPYAQIVPSEGQSLEAIAMTYCAWLAPPSSKDGTHSKYKNYSKWLVFFFPANPTDKLENAQKWHY